MKKSLPGIFKSLMYPGLGLCLLTLTFNSCKKDNLTAFDSEGSIETPLLNESRVYFDQLITNSPPAAGGNLRHQITKIPLWNQAQNIWSPDGESIKVPLTYEQEIYTYLGQNHDKVSLAELSYLLMYKDNLGNFHVEVVIKFPDPAFWDKRHHAGQEFYGNILIEDWWGNTIARYIIEQNGKMIALHKPANSESKTKPSAIENMAPPLECYDIDWYSCSHSRDFESPWECHYDYTEHLPCDWGRYPDYDPLGRMGERYRDRQEWSHGGGSGNRNNPSPASETSNTFKEADLGNVTFVPDPKPAIDPQKYIRCFEDGKTASAYKITLYVDQPIPGKNDQFVLVTGIHVLGTGNVLIKGGEYWDVGHTFVGFEKINTDGSVIKQVMGFYPDPNGNSLITNGVIKDDGGHPYDISYTVRATKTQFEAALTQLKNDASTSKYILSKFIGPEYNCTDAALKWIEHTGTNLLATPRGLFKNTPGDLGQKLRTLAGTNGVSGNAPSSKGSCNLFKF